MGSYTAFTREARVRVRDKKGGKFFGHVGTVVRQEGRTVHVQFSVLRDVDQVIPLDADWLERVYKNQSEARGQYPRGKYREKLNVTCAVCDRVLKGRKGADDELKPYPHLRDVPNGWGRFVPQDCPGSEQPAKLKEGVPA